jgi:hypothetical protein
VISLDPPRRQPGYGHALGVSRRADAMQLRDQALFGRPEPDGNVDCHGPSYAAASSKPA